MHLRSKVFKSLYDTVPEKFPAYRLRLKWPMGCASHTLHAGKADLGLPRMFIHPNQEQKTRSRDLEPDRFGARSVALELVPLLCSGPAFP